MLLPARSKALSVCLISPYLVRKRLQRERERERERERKRKVVHLIGWFTCPDKGVKLSYFKVHQDKRSKFKEKKKNLFGLSPMMPFSTRIGLSGKFFNKYKVSFYHTYFLDLYVRMHHSFHSNDEFKTKYFSLHTIKIILVNTY